MRAGGEMGENYVLAKISSYMYMRVYVHVWYHIHVSTCIRIHRVDWIRVNTHLDCSSQDVSIVRQPSGEGRAVIEGVPRSILGLFERGPKGIKLLPQL